MHTLLRPKLRQQNGSTLHTSLLASAMCNSASAVSSQSRRNRLKMPRMAERIRNCTTIAAHLSLPKDSHFVDPKIKPRDLMQHLCTAASTSILCQEYMFIPWYYAQDFRTYAEGDACLEVALLVVCGYSTGAVLHTMVRLVREGKLAPYSKCKPDVYVEKGWRWTARRQYCGRTGWNGVRHASESDRARITNDRYVHDSSHSPSPSN
jgi:hypothetical protein